jgi:lysyl-tRNA synthetase class 2
MKRLLARGCDRIFQICHCFRKEEHGRLHQSEFTMLEWYRKGWSYDDLMRQCEELFADLMRQCPDLPGVLDAGTIGWRGAALSLAPPWERLTVAEAFWRYAGIEVGVALRNDQFDELLVTAIEPCLGRERPVFLYDYPVKRGSLARRSQTNPQVAERFELYVAGVELANGFSELVDPEEQRIRFEEEIRLIRSAGRQGAGMPHTLLAELRQIGSAAGIALGVDRLCMLFMGIDEIASAVPFNFEEL